MFCDGNCLDKKTGKRCGLLFNCTTEQGNTEDGCAFLVMLGELMQIRERLLGVQQATESRRNNDARIGVAAVNAIQKGFSKLTKAALINNNPALALLDEDDE